MNKRPHTKGFRKRSTYEIDVTIHNNVINQIMITNASNDDCIYQIYDEFGEVLIHGVVESESIIHRPLSLMILRSTYIEVILIDLATQSIIESKRCRI